MATIATLKPGESRTYTVTYKALESDMGRTDLKEAVTAKAGATQASAASAAAKMEAKRTDFTATKTLTNSPADPEGFAEGETAEWNVAISNTGNQTISNVTITELLSGATITGGSTIASIAPKASATKQASYTIKADDLGREDLRNGVDVTSGSVKKSGIYSPVITVKAGFDGYFAYLYNGNELYFSNKRIDNHGNKTLTKSYEVDDKSYSTHSSLPWYWDRTNITIISGDRFKTPRYIDNWFNGISATDFSIMSSWDTSELISMAYAFAFNTKVSSLFGLEEWDTKGVTDMSYAFHGCTQLKNVNPLSKWKTGSVENLKRAFGQCDNLNDISGVSGWDTSTVNTMNGLFYGGKSLTSIAALANWSTSKVTSFQEAFMDCISVANLSTKMNWDTKSVESMGWMFSGCSSLTNVAGISGWNTSNVTNMFCMFYNDSKVSSFTALNSWNVARVTNHDMIFDGCTGTRPTWGKNW